MDLSVYIGLICLGVVGLMGLGFIGGLWFCSFLNKHHKEG